MGHRANLLVVSDSRPELYYSHWRAITLDVDLFWGPTLATAFVKSQQPADEIGWLDDIWAEGGAVVDHDRKILLFFGGEDVMDDVPRRRLHLALMSRVWRGWEVRWASRGILDIAAHVGVPAHEVLSDREGLEPDGERAEPPNLAAPVDRDRVTAIGTVRSADGRTRAFPTGEDVTDLLVAGPQLLSAAAAAAGEASVRWAQWTTDFPRGGFHLDEGERTLDFWLAPPSAQAADRVARQWPGWAVRFHGDRFERHLSLAGGVLEFPAPDPAAVAGVVRGRLLRPAGQSGADLMADVMAELAKGAGDAGQANPHALQDAQLDLSVTRKVEILDAAVADMRRGVLLEP